MESGYLLDSTTIITHSKCAIQISKRPWIQNVAFLRQNDHIGRVLGWQKHVFTTTSNAISALERYFPYHNRNRNRYRNHILNPFYRITGTVEHSRQYCRMLQYILKGSKRLQKVLDTLEQSKRL